MKDDYKSSESVVRERAELGSKDSEFHSLGDYYVMIRERWFLGLACALAICIGVGYFFATQPRIYQAQSALLWDQKERVVDMPQVVDMGLDGGGGAMWRVLLENHINQLSSRSFREYVVMSFSEEEAQRIIAAHLAGEETDRAPSLSGALGQVLVENVSGSFVIGIQVRHRDPEVAALVADRYAERYIEFARDRRDDVNIEAIEFLKQRAEEFRQRVNEAEQALQEYRREHNLGAVEENRTLVGERLDSINVSLMQARVERLDLEGQLRHIARILENEAEMIELGGVVSSESIRTFVQRRDELRHEREVMSEKYLEQHPRMISNQRAIEATERLIRENIERAMTDIRNRLANARERETTLLAGLADAENESLALGQLKIAYAGLQRSADGMRQAHAQILNRLNETTITSRLQSSTIRIVDRASIPKRPVEPDLRKAAILIVFLGGFFFVGVPVGLGLLEHRLKASHEVENLLGRRLLGEIPSVRKVKKKERPHLVEKDLDDAAAESFRSIISQLQMSWENQYPKALISTSTIPGEGKSFIATNLAGCFAAHGCKTLLIDFDLRRPTLHQVYDLPNDVGILHWLKEGDGKVGDLLNDDLLGITEVRHNLFLLRAGGSTKKATESIANPAVGEMIGGLKSEFDLLIFDCPPFGIFPDAFSLCRFVDHALYIVRFGKVDRRQVKAYIDRFDEANVELTGVVMNGMPTGRRYAHCHYGYACGNDKYQKYYSSRA
jgi:polysaccharide biosynthesis transport protein